ncbi:MAG: glutathione-regulated potassium-efflux system protein KefB, partial [Proteobacteria bacterium]|nr:glutathione-regulated potassium-efflux system protein KefB [Pseudomonadota bacterium]
LVRHHFPDVPVYARARNRQHVYRLMEQGVLQMRRETFLSAIELTRDLLTGLGIPEVEARRMTETFAALDRKRLYDDYAHASDARRLEVQARRFAEELEEIFRQDTADAARIAKGEMPSKSETRPKPTEKEKTPLTAGTAPEAAEPPRSA